MKTAAKVFIILSMIVLFWCIFPLIVGAIALKRLETAKTKNDLVGIGVVTLLFCSFIGGILMLCIDENDLNQDSINNNDDIKLDKEMCTIFERITAFREKRANPKRTKKNISIEEDVSNTIRSEDDLGTKDISFDVASMEKRKITAGYLLIVI